jgi:uncharacterized ion transporter superfamily protein YfcC
MGRDFVEIASLLIGLALVSMLVTRASGTSQVIQAGTSGFANLLNAATMSGSSPFGAGSFPTLG